MRLPSEDAVFFAFRTMNGTGVGVDTTSDEHQKRPRVGLEISDDRQKKVGVDCGISGERQSNQR